MAAAAIARTARARIVAADAMGTAAVSGTGVDAEATARVRACCRGAPVPGAALAAA